MQVKIQAPGSGKQVILEETNRRISPVGGLSTLAAWFTRIGFMEKLHELMPFRYASHNAIAPAHTFVAFLVSIILGGERFAHVERLRGDEVLKALFGLKRTPGDDTVRNFFKRFTRQRVDAFFMPLQAWLLGLVADCDTALDLDSTVICRHGEKQEGARKGYNPRRPGRLSHHPLLAFLDKPVFMLHGWLRSGNTASKTGVTEFLKEALAMLPASLRIRTVRADKKDPLSQLMRKQGFPVEDCQSRPHSTDIFSFPVQCPAHAVQRNDRTAIEQLEHYLLYQTHWSERSVSVTIYVKEHEWLAVGDWVYTHFDKLAGVAFLPHSDHIYPQAPYSECTPEAYAEMVARMPQFDWEELALFEQDDATVNTKELACTAGHCELM